MLKLLRVNHGSLLSLQLKNSAFLTPISHLHDWSKTLIDTDSGQGLIRDGAEEVQSSRGDLNPVEKFSFKPPEPTISMKPGQEVQIRHPWPEWVELMKQLLSNGYFESDVDFLRKEKLDSKDANRVRTACLNFARDRSGLMRYLSKRDLHLLAVCGCPTTDRKVVNSGKRLRAYMGIWEEKVCNTCSLRGACEKACLYANNNEDGRTSDVMRFLLTIGLDPVTGVVENMRCVDNAAVESARRLLKQIVDLSKGEVDSDFKENLLLERSSSVPQRSTNQEQGHVFFPTKEAKWKDSRSSEGYQREHHNHHRLKKGDWTCHKCNFMNFAKNLRCMNCNVQPSLRQLSPGEWECDSCNYINFRQNTSCLKCEHRRYRSSI